MSIIDLLILQILAHLLSDYTLQSDKWAQNKIRNGFKSKYQKWHSLITIVISWALSFQWLFIVASVPIAISHWIIDGYKKDLNNHKKIRKISFFIDQSLHLLVILGFTLLFYCFFSIEPYLKLPVNTHWLLIITGYVLCTKPANIFIKEVFKAYAISIEKEKEGNEDVLNAGRLIGIIERVITLTLILYGQFEAVGFIIAGKSILRYKETDTSKTEYVLIGTLLSFGVAILIGIAILKFHF
ncbi:MAG TPA: DUF3307 domain-containing protein [Williamwhitmania sp.]|nr:DUF3307 domain-containing protein [Williamwhitmania sp.]